jgi:predicted transcriptional regulator
MEQGSKSSKEQNVLIDLTAKIVASYVGKNSIRIGEITDIIGSVYSTLGGLTFSSPERTTTQTPAVPIKKSIHPDYLVCLEDGKKLKMLKRHLRTSYGITPEQYRTKWGLPPDYPMAAPNYTLSRSEFAKKSGFGTKKARMRRVRKVGAEA